MNNPPPHSLYAVGQQIFPPSEDGAIFEIDASGPMLILKFKRPTSREKNSIRNDVPQFRLAIVDGVIFVLFRFGTGQWMDAPYNAHLSNYELYTPPEGYGLLLHIMLVDASTGVLLLNRAVGLSTEFSTLLLHAAAQQPDLGTPEEYYARVDRIYAQYSTEDLFRFEVKLE